MIAVTASVHASVAGLAVIVPGCLLLIVTIVFEVETRSSPFCESGLTPITIKRGFKYFWFKQRE